jgi:class 3 adenylate cyclase
MYAAVRRMQAGYIPATFFALGWGVIAIGYCLNMLAIYMGTFRFLIYSGYVAYAVESMLFAVALAYRTRDSEQRAVQDKVHALSQLQKVVYSHQMEQIKQGRELEETMPTSSGHACVISFDIIGSSKIKHIRSKEFFRNVFARCNAIMSEGYDGISLQANAYRVKEMGDGFLCSVGYPFKSMTVNPANEAVDLSRRFAQALSEEAEILHSEIPIACGIGIALDTLTGFYPEAGTKEYDIYGPALILATRYEGMRKTLFEANKGQSVLIIQEQVFQSLDPSHRNGFRVFNLQEAGLVVRDDPAATKLYYQFLDENLASADITPGHLKVV